MRSAATEQPGLEPTEAPADYASKPGMARSSAAAKRGRINLLFVIDQLCGRGGAERMLLKMVEGLPKDRFQCQLLTFKHDPEVFGQTPCPLHVFPLRRTYDLNALKAALRIRSLIREHRIDIVHTFHETSDLWGGLLAKASGCPVLVSSRRDMGFLRSTKHEIGYRILNPHFDKVLAVSEQVRQRCIEVDGLSPAKVVTIHNGIDLARVDEEQADRLCRSGLGISDDAPLITTVGNIRRVKGLEALIGAAERVCRQHPNAMFLVVGESPEKDYFEELRQLVEVRRLTCNVRFAGTREDVFAILKVSDIFCLPSRTEGFSNALIEAMACRLPCVVSNVGGNGEAIRDGENGYLTPPDNSGIMADRILQLLQFPSKARELGRMARRTVEEQFTFDAMIGKLITIYDELLGSGQKPPGQE